MMHEVMYEVSNSRRVPHRRTLPAVLLLLPALLLLLGCSSDSAPPGAAATFADPPLERPQVARGCDAASLDAPDKLRPCHHGGGIFGYWFLDAAGLPAYEYILDQRRDDRARYDHSRDPDARAHFHQVGNRRVNAVAYNHGYVELVGQERGVTFHNRYHAPDHNYAGGFSIIGEDDVAWNTAFLHAPERARTRRVFGMGYFESVTQHRGIRVTRRVIAPPGDDPLLVDEVTIENLGDRARTLRHYEYWDVNRHQAVFQPARSGPLAQAGDRARRKLNEAFEQVLARDGNVLRAAFVLGAGATRPAREAVSEVDHYPAPQFVASLDDAPDDVYTDQSAFIGDGTIAAPAAAAQPRPGELMARHGAFLQPAALIMRHDIALAAGAKKTLRFAYGYVPGAAGDDDASTRAAIDTLVARYRDKRELARETGEHWRSAVAYLGVDSTRLQSRVLSREVPWHAYNLLSATAQLSYFETAVTPQGSAYLYLHGFDGAPRDQALFSLPLSYLAPELARANLELIMRLTRRDSGQISYSYHGNGFLEGAIIHQEPSDLDIFLMLGVAEYLAATGDAAFLQKRVPFFPKEEDAGGETVLEHLRTALRHLRDRVGRGEHGLVRISDGDWSDGIVWTSGDKVDSAETVKYGESIPNTQMAAYVLPRLAAQLDAHDAKLAQGLRDYGAQLAIAARAAFNGKWFTRAWMRGVDHRPLLLGDTALDLQSQPWGVIAPGLLSPSLTRTLLDTVYDKVDKDSFLGPMLGAEGSSVWPAVSQLQTWAYTRSRPDLAWRSLERHALASHAAAFPEQWYGIWSAPDGMSGKSGRSWSSVATPMQDWPVMNQNAHAMYLLGLLRAAGVEPRGRGLEIRPNAAAPDATLELPLLRLSKRGDSARGEYRALTDAELTLTLRAPQGYRLVEAKGPDGAALAIDTDGLAHLPLKLARGERSSFELRWTAP
ncbi:MAG: hypothetical protein KC503_21875 [Myxococcales bacterium]|nr:hypothetical protein [Myxococcales bacterium]